MKSARWWIGLALAIMPGPAAAQRPDPQPLDSELPALKLLTQPSIQTSPTQRLVLIDQALAMLAQPTPFRGAVLCARAQVLQFLTRYDEARASLEQCRQLLPDDPRVLVGSAFDEAEQRRPVEAAKLLIRAAQLGPDAVRQIPPSSMGMVLRPLRYARADKVLDDLMASLAASGWGRDNPEVFAEVAVPVVRHMIIDGREADALAMLPSILSPKAGLAMLIDRRYAAIWPQVGAWAGPDLSVQRRALLAGTRAAYQTSRSPDDFLAYTAALTQTGHRDQAISELRTWLAAPPAQINPWYRNAVVVRFGNFLGQSGKREEGIARMKAALGGPDALDRSVANIVPNLVIHMLLVQDYAGALGVLDAHTPDASGVEAQPALGYFIALRACALAGAGRKSEADRELLRVQTVYAANDDAVRMAVGCMAAPDVQAALWIKRADNDETRTNALVELATARARAAKGLAVDSLDEAALRQIAARADVAAVYDRLGRALPEGYVPALLEFEGVPDV